MTVWIILIILFLYGIQDCCTHKLMIWPMPVLFAGGILYHIVTRECTILEILLGIALGAGMILLSRITRESIGYGDGGLMMVIGAYEGISRSIMILFFGLLYAAVFSIVMIVVRKWKRNQELPFVPFLFLGAVTTFFLI